MAVPRWLKWTVGILGGLAVVFVALVAGGLWLLSSHITPDVAVGEPLPVIELASLGGGEPIEIEGYRGQVVVLDFWASW